MVVHLYHPSHSTISVLIPMVLGDPPFWETCKWSAEFCRSTGCLRYFSFGENLKTLSIDSGWQVWSAAPTSFQIFSREPKEEAPQIGSQEQGEMDFDSELLSAKRTTCDIWIDMDCFPLLLYPSSNWVDFCRLDPGHRRDSKVQRRYLRGEVPWWWRMGWL